MKGNVYFALCGNLVKIGFARDVGKRLVELQCGNPKPITIVAVIPDVLPSVERHLHREFAESRVRGEWFHYTDLKRLIGSVQGGAQPKTPQAIRYAAEFAPKRERIPPPAGMGAACGEVRKSVKDGTFAEKRAEFLSRGSPFTEAVAAVTKRLQ
jgi:hypothetical protein